MKTYILTITEEDEGKINTSSINEGFCATELIGFLELKKQDLLNQMMYPSRFDHILKEDDRTIEIKDK